MAKKTEKVEKEEKNDYLAKIQKEIDSEFGEGVLSSSRLILENPRQVIKFSPALDGALGGGIPEGCLVTCSGPPKGGKALANYELVQTPNGPKQISEIIVGDTVCSPCGHVKVSGVFPQGKKEIYRVYFENGDYVDCDLDHLWAVRTRESKKIVKSLKELMDTGLSCEKGNRNKYIIDLAETKYNKRKVNIKPYILGCLLGDGGITNKYAVNFTSSDSFIVNKINKELPNNLSLKLKSSRNKIDYRIDCKRNKNVIRINLEKYGLIGKNSHTKFIPKDYIYNDRQTRLEIVRGLMDTDGYVPKNKNGCVYYTTSLQMAYDFKEIIHSLGGIVTITNKTTECNNNKFNSYVCYIKYDNPAELFKLPRKKNICTKRRKGKLYRTINKVEKIGIHEATCIKVDSLSGLFLTKLGIVTHNTTSTLHFCSKFQQPEYGNRHVYYLDAEARLKPMNLSCIPGLDLDRFHHIHSIEGNILTAEKFLTIAEKILYTHPGSLVVIDSISCLCPEAEMTGDLTAQFRASGPRLFSLFCKRVANILPVNRVTLWGIQHTHSSMGPGAGKSEDGGLKIQYALDVKMRMNWAEDWTVGTNENQRVVGKIAHWNIITSALGSSPNQKVDSYIRFGVGIDEIKENIETGVSLDIIKKGGAWYTFNEEKFQGEEKLYQAFTTNPDMVKLLEEKIKELTG